MVLVANLLAGEAFFQGLHQVASGAINSSRCMQKKYVQERLDAKRAIESLM